MRPAPTIEVVVRSIGEWRFEGGGFVKILVGGDVETETAIEWTETLIRMKREELAKSAAVKAAPAGVET